MRRSRHHPISFDRSVDDVDLAVAVADGVLRIEAKAHLLEPHKTWFMVNQRARDRSARRGAVGYLPVISALGAGRAIVGRLITIDELHAWPAPNKALKDPAVGIELKQLCAEYLDGDLAQIAEAIQPRCPSLRGAGCEEARGRSRARPHHVAVSATAPRRATGTSRRASHPRPPVAAGTPMDAKCLQGTGSRPPDCRTSARRATMAAVVTPFPTAPSRSTAGLAAWTSASSRPASTSSGPSITTASPSRPTTTTSCHAPCAATSSRSSRPLGCRRTSSSAGRHVRASQSSAAWIPPTLVAGMSSTFSTPSTPCARERS